jgi:Na+/H+-dicarboxylate symporter
MNRFARSYLGLFISIALGIGTGFSNLYLLQTAASVVSTLFLNYLSLIAAPIVLLAILSTLMNMNGLEQMRRLGGKVVVYTLLTTTLAATVALGCFLALDPVSAVQGGTESVLRVEESSYLDFLVDIVPSNLVKAFLDNKVISLAFLGFLLGITAHFLPEEQRKTLRVGVSALFQLFLKLAGLIAHVMPVAIWAFMALLVKEVQEKSSEVSGLWVYLSAVVLANFIQGVVVIPLLLKAKGLSPWKLFKGSSRALLMAFFTKSSNATLPVSLKVAQEELGIRSKVAHFTLPLCTVINMNGCAAFILTTVLFVAGIHGHLFSPLDLVFWVFMAVLAAVGNAGVPMGCFFLSSAFLISMDVPLTTMGLILPFYALIDMEETALNVWSDLSVTAIVDREYSEVEACQQQIP